MSSANGRPPWFNWWRDVARSGRLRDLGTVDAALLALIATYADEQLQAWVGIPTLADLLGLNAATVSTSLSRLAAAGLIHRRRRFGRSAITTLANIAHGQSSPPANDWPSATSNIAQGQCRSLRTANIRTIQQNDPAERSRKTRASATGESIYAAYPRKVGKTKALKAIGKALDDIARRKPAPADPAAWLLERVRAFAASPAGKRGEFTPHPANWFLAARYDDDPREWGDREPRNGRRLPPAHLPAAFDREDN